MASLAETESMHALLPYASPGKLLFRGGFFLLRLANVLQLVPANDIQVDPMSPSPRRSVQSDAGELSYCRLSHQLTSDVTRLLQVNPTKARNRRTLCSAYVVLHYSLKIQLRNDKGSLTIKSTMRLQSSRIVSIGI
jgi:hypothetical protein